MSSSRLLSRFGRTVVVRSVSSSGSDEYGNPAETETTATVVGHVRLLRAEELPEGVSGTRWKLYLPTPTAIDVDDRVTYEGDLYEVVTVPIERTNPRTSLTEAIEVEIERVA